ncbi:hypothetical protein AK830_g5647 [Neonectria ditissima]|uniref:DNA ligase n=1 Tax=Neonectria ditissima TaxID=78410 RepID=A0A0P7B3D6_9HYPO|nr:hypothetical protein AK830_g5647 [Neonectria ditissima]
MPSPAKKRKLNSSNAKPVASNTRGLEYFFSKQRQNGSENSSHADTASGVAMAEMTDEELARKLQAEWDQEERETAQPKSETIPDEAEGNESTQTKEISHDSGQSHTLVLPSSLAKPSPTKDGSKATLGLQAAGMSEDTTSTSIPLDESPLTFQLSQYLSQLREHWTSDGGDASYALLISELSKDLDRRGSFKSVACGLVGNELHIAALYIHGIGARWICDLESPKNYAGDVAFEAKKKQSFTLRKPKPLTIKGVYQSLVKIANSQGQGSGEAKQRLVDRLLQDARGGEESRFVVRTLCQHLRIGAVKTTMLIALSRAFLLSRPPGTEFSLRSASELSKLKKDELSEVWARGEEIVKSCFAKRPNYSDLVPALLDIGISDELLIRCGITVHVPLRPMLGSITRDLSEMLTKLQGRDFACEYKYDGQRAQIHCDEKGKVSIFSRHLELMTEKYPDLVELIPKIRGEGVESFIMEGEVVAVDSTTGELKNFQTLTNRARKDVDIGSITISVCLFSFDLMYLNGQPLLDRSFRERRELLRSLFTEIPNHFTWVKSLDATSGDSEAVLEFFKSATEGKCEGLMVKILDNLSTLPSTVDTEEQIPDDKEKIILPKSKTKGKGKAKSAAEEDGKTKSRRKPLLATYEPDKRLDSWLKVKKDYNSSFDTLDLIPVAAWHGSGRKAKWWSPILLAVRNEETGSLEAVCKCMSGFTDTFYKANREFYDDGKESGETKNTRSQKPSFVEYSGPEPDVWFEPQEVWEVAFADITLSPTYTAAIGLISDERGLSLRFPRFMKKREDKGIDEASTNEFLAGLWRKQDATAAKTQAGQGVEEEE